VSGRGAVGPEPQEAVVSTTAIVAVTAVIVVWGAVAGRLERVELTAPMVLTVIGGTFAAVGLVDAHEVPPIVQPLVELTLVWVLFADAARVRVHDLRNDLGRALRLLGAGLPLTVLAGWGLAAWLFPGLGLWAALLIGAALAPTDAALGVPVVTNPVVPGRIRRLITVESGLNDGIVTPVVLVAVAGMVSGSGPTGGEALLELAIGVLVGVGVGVGGGRLLRAARAHGWAAEDFVGISVLALALLAYTAAIAVHGNGFVAAFCGGMAFGGAAGRRGRAELVFLEQASGLVSLLVWLAFGAFAVPVVLHDLDWRAVLYAVLSLTLVRMVPVALSLIGSGLDRETVLFIGWFGPRGLASLVFALIALEEAGPVARQAVAVIALTVLLSVLAHGMSASPLAIRYGRSRQGDVPGPETADAPAIPVRRLPRTSAAPAPRATPES
jgi:NhaP-type Na+/H+ or K+/H+ antiporter